MVIQMRIITSSEKCSERRKFCLPEQRSLLMHLFRLYDPLYLNSWQRLLPRRFQWRPFSPRTRWEVTWSAKKSSNRFFHKSKQLCRQSLAKKALWIGQRMILDVSLPKKLFFYRELWSKLLKEALLLLLLLACNQVQNIFQMEQKYSGTKFVQNQTKNACKQNLFQIEQKSGNKKCSQRKIALNWTKSLFCIF